MLDSNIKCNKYHVVETFFSHFDICKRFVFRKRISDTKFKMAKLIKEFQMIYSEPIKIESVADGNFPWNENQQESLFTGSIFEVCARL